jgi:hypothetical protein
MWRMAVFSTALILGGLLRRFGAVLFGIFCCQGISGRLK